MRDAELIIGDDCGFSGTVLFAASSVRIGNRVLCGANTSVVDTDFHPLDANARANHGSAEPVPTVIEDDVWLGMNVVVLKGCHIHKRSIIAANSLVTRSIPPDVVAGGYPAKVLKRLK